MAEDLSSDRTRRSTTRSLTASLAAAVQNAYSKPKSLAGRTTQGSDSEVCSVSTVGSQSLVPYLSPTSNQDMGCLEFGESTLVVSAGQSRGESQIYPITNRQFPFHETQPKKKSLFKIRAKLSRKIIILEKRPGRRKTTSGNRGSEPAPRGRREIEE